MNENSIPTIPIREIPKGIVPIKYVAEELECNYYTLRTVCFKEGLKFYKFADMVLCIDRELAIEAWNKRPKAGRPWHKEKESK